MPRLLLYILVSFRFASMAQEVSSGQVYFATGKYNLDEEAKQIIDGSISALKNIPKAYQVIIYGHTDNVGALEYNEQLSNNRARSVKSYFIKKGFGNENISVDAFAYNKPSAENNTDEGKAKNRRVNFRIVAKSPDLFSILKSSSLTSVYKIDAQKGDTLYYPSGTRIIIPASVFETMDGKPVSGEVKLKYTEYRSPLDFMRSGIPMSFKKDGELAQFNSGGMFRIEATQGNEPLKLKTKEEIKIEFKQTQELPNMQFFAFDSTHLNWTATAHQTPVASSSNAAGSVITFELGGKNSGPIRKKVRGKDSCLLTSCVGNSMAARKGFELATSPWPINEKRAPVYFKKLKSSFYQQATYKLKILKENKTTVEFILIPKDSSAVYGEFVGYHWLYTTNKQYPFRKEWEKVVWLRVKVDYELENNFTLNLYDNEEHFGLAVQALVKYKAKSAQDLYEYHQHNRNTNLEKYVLQKTRNDAYDRLLEEKASKDDSVSVTVFRKRCEDSLFCFYQYSRQWMDQANGEANLKYEQWLDYFNANKTLMASRYGKIKDEVKAVDTECMATEKKRQEEELKSLRNNFIRDSSIMVNKSAQEDILNSQVKELSITSLGIWNCDQIQRLKAPVYVKTTFRDEKGNLVEPVVVYVIDKEVNGVLTYNGYLDLSPYYFPVSSASENTLVAFDVNNKGYICSAQRFRDYLKEKNSAPIVLEKLNNPGKQLEEISSAKP